jgi:Brp/Blh family beta-carotene 15,15'-monooxygenase
MNISLNSKFKINFLFITIGLLFIWVHNFLPSLEIRFGYMFFFCVVLTLGLVHGCLDFEIEKINDKETSLIWFLFSYILQILLVAIVWFFNPHLALFIFLACTAWHFGETDLSLFKADSSPTIIWLYGVGVTSWLLGCHLDDNLPYIYSLGLAKTSDIFFLANIEKITLYVRIASLFFLCVAVYFSNLYKSQNNIFLLSMLLLITYLLPILSAFTVYFGFWHSLNTLYLIKNDIQVTMKKLIYKAAPYLLVSVVMTMVMIKLFAVFNFGSETVLLVFVSSLTLPHAITMHGLLNRYRLS